MEREPCFAHVYVWMCAHRWLVAPPALMLRPLPSCLQSLTAIDGTPFKEDKWDRPEGGGGRTRVLQGGNVSAPPHLLRAQASPV